MKNVENLGHLETEFCLNDFTDILFVSYSFLNLIQTTHVRVAKGNRKNKIC